MGDNDSRCSCCIHNLKMATGIAGSKRAYKQDLPPKGGYEPFNYKRIPARKMYIAPLLFGGFILWEIMAHWRYKRGRRYLEAEKTEERSTQFALEPMLLAERDRAFVKRLKENRDFEEHLIKDVKGWEVGTYFGVPLYKDPSVNKYPLLPWLEFYVHCRPYPIQAEVRHREWWVS